MLGILGFGFACFRLACRIHPTFHSLDNASPSYLNPKTLLNLKALRPILIPGAPRAPGIS